jgi:hypothetical protein
MMTDKDKLPEPVQKYFSVLVESLYQRDKTPENEDLLLEELDDIWLKFTTEESNIVSKIFSNFQPPIFSLSKRSPQPVDCDDNGNVWVYCEDDMRWEYMSYGSQNLDYGPAQSYGLTHFCCGRFFPIPEKETND